MVLISKIHNHLIFLQITTDKKEDLHNDFTSAMQKFLDKSRNADDTEDNIRSLQKFTSMLWNADDTFWNSLGTSKTQVCTYSEKKQLCMIQVIINFKLLNELVETQTQLTQNYFCGIKYWIRFIKETTKTERA